MDALAPRANATSIAMAWRSLRLIIADDEPDTVLTLSALLDHEGHSVVGVHSAPAALREVRKEMPDALIVDISMPGPSGYQVAREIRELRGERRGPLLIAISGRWTGQTDRMLSELAGFDHFIAKPCSLAGLLRLLQPLTTQPRLTE